MDAGRIIQQGTHQSLMARTGTYREIHDLQSRIEAGPGESHEAENGAEKAFQLKTPFRETVVRPPSIAARR